MLRRVTRIDAPYHIILLGARQVGKASLLSLLAGEAYEHRREELFEHDKYLYRIVVVASAHGPQWETERKKAHAIICMLDMTTVADNDHQANAALSELVGLLQAKALARLPVLVLGNKIDAWNARVGPEGVEQRTGVYGYQKTRRGPVGIFYVSCHKKQGFREAFAWLFDVL